MRPIFNMPKESQSSSLKRPDTAKLERPVLLDPTYMNAIDMTRLNHHDPLLINLESFLIINPNATSNSIKIPKVRKLTNVYKTRSRTDKNEDEDDDRSFKKLDDVVPSPCKACGRKDFPERFHSHPKTLTRKHQTTYPDSKLLMKNTVTKPMPIKYRSGRVKDDPPNPNPTSQPVHNSEILHNTTIQNRKKDSIVKINSFYKQNQQSILKSRQEFQQRSQGDFEVLKSPYCYICGKTFGSHSNESLEDHMQHCLAKWKDSHHQEVSSASTTPVPVRPEEAQNESFWINHLTQLIPCRRCGRKFNPDRVQVHERSCKGITK